MDKDPQDAKDEQERRPSSNSPPGGKTHEATKPPKPGDLDPEAEARSREGLDIASGGH